MAYLSTRLRGCHHQHIFGISQNGVVEQDAEEHQGQRDDLLSFRLRRKHAFGFCGVDVEQRACPKLWTKQKPLSREPLAVTILLLALLPEYLTPCGGRHTTDLHRSGQECPPTSFRCALLGSAFCFSALCPLLAVLLSSVLFVVRGCHGLLPHINWRECALKGVALPGCG